MKLRHWQSECSSKAIDHFKNVGEHFLCMATPGAGKTIMAAEVSLKLIEEDLIDFVLCFSPSATVASGFRASFSKYLNQPFDGRIGAIGSSYTYQSLPHFDDLFWDLLKNNRVFVIFDEIHHCSGTTVEDSNVWGHEIIRNIQFQAAYTLALTGTPWRSDHTPIALAQYKGSENRIQCQYSYGLREAVNDNVCRTPSIVLIDNERIQVTNQYNESELYSSFKSLLNAKTVAYQDIVTNTDAIRFVLKKGCLKLFQIRQTKANAGGLVVASSVEHANQILEILVKELSQSAVIVSYRLDSPTSVIDEYRTNSVEWIVAIGMVSEGTDIPRLQVCCHLSRIKTELYFRQVLGRILRVDEKSRQKAWLYTFNDPTLEKYASRVAIDLPEVPVIIKEHFSEEDNKFNNSIHLDALQKPMFDTSIDKTPDLIDPLSSLASQHSVEETHSQPTLYSFEILGNFREKVLATFNSPFN